MKFPSKVPSATPRVVKSFRLSNLDGVRDVQVGKASVEARGEREFAKDEVEGPRHEAMEMGGGDAATFDDVQARQDRYKSLW